MTPVATALAAVALFFFAHSLLSLYLMLYAWHSPERLRFVHGPCRLRPPEVSFTAIVPARHEKSVIYDTIMRLADAHYPPHLLEIVVVCHEDDLETILEVRRAASACGADRVLTAVFGGMLISKPIALNVGLSLTRNEVVCVFDAEDDVHPEIFNMINTVLVEEDCDVVQAAVQLMNYQDRWFSLQNCLEYFFWFKSRLVFHAQHRFVPLGGNTVFMKRLLIKAIGGWNEACLTEDAEIGVRLSAVGARTRIVYEPSLATREEAPGSIGSLVRQRTRWHQGFLQILGKREWQRLPGVRARALAVYTLSFPIVQALLLALWPAMIASALFLRLPTAVAMTTMLPLYAVGFQCLMSVVGAYLFAREFGIGMAHWRAWSTPLTFLPFQWLMGVSAVRAAWRLCSRHNDWEKTAHRGAHRVPQVVPELDPAAA